MEPVPESARLLDQLSRFDSGLPGVSDLGDQVQQLVPSCVGLSVTLLEDQLTITLVSSSSSIAQLDALQYLGDGPCVTAIQDGQLRTTDVEQAPTRGWELFAQGEAMFGIASTLSIPLRRDGVTACVNLYATRADAFRDNVEVIARLCDGSAMDAVHDADLPFASRLRASVAPSRLADRDEVDLAVGVLAAQLGLEVEEADVRLREGAARADVSVLHLARVINESSLS